MVLNASLVTWLCANTEKLKRREVKKKQKQLHC